MQPSDVEAVPGKALDVRSTVRDAKEDRRRSLKVFHRTSGLILTWGFVFLPYVVSQIGVTLSIALFISTLFASYYGAYHLVFNHAVNGGTNRYYREVVSPATGSRRECSLVGIWRWAAMMLATTAIFALAGTTLYSLHKEFCDAQCKAYSVSSWALIFSLFLAFCSAIEPLRQGLLQLQAIPGGLAAILILAMVSVDLFVLHPQGLECDTDYIAQGSSELTLAFSAVSLGTTAFIFGGHLMMPEVLTSLQLPSSPGATLKVMECLGASYAVAVMFFLPLAYIGSSAYGMCTQPNILDSPTSQPYLKIVAQFLLLVQLAVDACIRDDATQPSVPAAAKSGRKANRSNGCILLRRVAVMAVSGVVAAFLPLTLEFSGLAGALFILPLAYMIPALLSQATGVDSQWDPQWLLNTALVTLYTLICLLSTCGTIYLLFSAGATRWSELVAGSVMSMFSGPG